MKHALLLGVIFAALAELSAKDCRGEYYLYYNCLNQVSDDFSTTRKLNDGQWIQLENDVTRIYRE